MSHNLSNLRVRNKPTSANEGQGDSCAVNSGNITTHDVAKVAGVSQMTVSRVLSGKGYVSQKTRKLVEEKAKELGYIPNHAARAMRTGNTKTIGIIIPSANVGMNSSKLESIEKALLEYDYNSAITFTGDKSERLLKALDNMLSRNVDGLIIRHDHSLTTDRKSKKILNKLNNLQIPFVIYDACDFSRRNNLPSVAIDRSIAMKEVASHLKNINKDDVWFWLPNLTNSNISKRKGFLQEAKKQGLTLREPDIQAYIDDFLKTNYSKSKQKQINENNVSTWRKQERVAFRDSLRKMLTSERLPSAIVTGTDHFSMIAIQELQAIDITIPDDIAIVGYNNIFEASLTSPPLTTVSQPSTQMAKHTVQMILDSINLNSKDKKNEFVELPTNLIIRESTAGKDIQKMKLSNNDEDSLAPSLSLSTELGA